MEKDSLAAGMKGQDNYSSCSNGRIQWNDFEV